MTSVSSEVASLPVTQATDFLRWLHDGEPFEVCIIGPLKPTSSLWEGRANGRSTIAGWFIDPEKAAKLACQAQAKGIYVTLNPTKDELLARAESRFKAGVDRTADKGISKINNLLIDIDPNRESGISSTDEEHAASIKVARIIADELLAESWPEPVYGDSGNGAHLIYPINLANNDENKSLIQNVLKALAHKFKDILEEHNLGLDTKVYNPARLTKLYGTWTRKGDNTKSRPHRLAKLIRLPNRQVIPKENLIDLANTLPPDDSKRLSSAPTGDMLDVKAYLEAYGIEIIKIKTHGSSTLYCLRECLFDPSHQPNEAYIGQAVDGKLFYKCFHNSCQGKTWADAKVVISGTDNLKGFMPARAVRFSQPPKGAGQEQSDSICFLYKADDNKRIREVLSKSNIPLPDQTYILDKLIEKPAQKNLTQEINEWVLTTNGVFLTTNVYQDLNLTTRDDKKHASKCLQRLVEKGKIVTHGDKRGQYRVVTELDEMDWLSANIDDVYKINWPFELERYVEIYPGNIIVVAGEKGAGKSTFMYNLIRLNQDQRKIAYFNSESGPQELKKRLCNFQGMGVSLKDWKFKAYARSTNFPEVIFPDKLNIIDYFEFDPDKGFHVIAGELRKIHDRLRRGICVVALQMKIGADLGRGADFSMEKARLYLTMNRKGILKIVDAKMWASETNPKGLEFKYKLIQGAKFLEWE